mgnify:CR=1 FL=1
MLQIPVWDLLASYSGDSKNFTFAWEIYDGYMEDIQFLKPLEFQIKIISLDDGVEVIFDDLKTEILYEWQKHSIDIGNFERTFKKYIDPLIDGDDVRLIENMQIDLTPVIREELIIASMSL